MVLRRMRLRWFMKLFSLVGDSCRSGEKRHSTLVVLTVYDTIGKDCRSSYLDQTVASMALTFPFMRSAILKAAS